MRFDLRSYLGCIGMMLHCNTQTWLNAKPVVESGGLFTNLKGNNFQSYPVREHLPYSSSSSYMDSLQILEHGKRLPSSNPRQRLRHCLTQRIPPLPRRLHSTWLPLLLRLPRPNIRPHLPGHVLRPPSSPTHPHKPSFPSYRRRFIRRTRPLAT